MIWVGWPMLSWAKPISSASAGGRLGQEGQGQRDDLIGGLGVQVVAGALDDRRATEVTHEGDQVAGDVGAAQPRLESPQPRMSTLATR